MDYGLCSTAHEQITYHELCTILILINSSDGLFLNYRSRIINHIWAVDDDL